MTRLAGFLSLFVIASALAAAAGVVPNKASIWIPSLPAPPLTSKSWATTRCM